MPYGLWARMGRRNRVLYGGPAVLKDVAMATNFGTLLAITGFVGYNFGCVIASDTLFDSRAGFSGSSYPMKTQPISRFYKARCHGNHFWLSILYGVHIGATWRIRLNRQCATTCYFREHGGKVCYPRLPCCYVLIFNIRSCCRMTVLTVLRFGKKTGEN